MALTRSLGLPMLTFYGVGMILGAGIYSIIGKAAALAGEGLWLGFVLAAAAALFTALSYAELAAMYPKAGGEYVFLRSAFPRLRWAAAATGILMAFAGCATASTVALAFSGYLGHFAELPGPWVAAGLLALFTGVNVLGIRESGWVNAVFTLLEVAGLLLFVWLGWREERFGEALLAAPGAETVSSAALIVFAYFGFENIVNLSEEAREPGRTIPRAILLSLSVSTVLYVFVSLAAVALMTPAELGATDAPLTAAAQGVSGRAAGALGGIALFSTANTALIALVTTSRILYGIARDGSLPPVLARVSARRKSPWAAALASLAVSAGLLTVGRVEAAASVSSLATMAAFIAVNVSLIVLRRREPRRERPFRVPLSLGGLPVLPVLGILSAATFLLQFDRDVYTIGALASAGAAGLYLLTRLVTSRGPVSPSG